MNMSSFTMGRMGLLIMTCTIVMSLSGYFLFSPSNLNPNKTVGSAGMAPDRNGNMIKPVGTD